MARQRLAQDIVQLRDQNRWAFNADGSVNLGMLRAVVQRFLDRLVVIRFAEDHLVLPPGTLRRLYEYRQGNLYSAEVQWLLNDFFRSFDENHNSALFAPGIVDQRTTFSDDMLLPLIGKLYEARYRSMPADIIGNTYEQYLGTTPVQRNGSIVTSDNLETRKNQGSYYTPQVIVRFIVDNSLGRYLYGTENGKPDGNPVEQRKTSHDIRDLRVLDSACGSGSFLIYAFYVLEEKDTYPTYTGLREKTEALAETLNVDFAEHFTAIDRVRPFHWGIEFPEVFYDELIETYRANK